MEEWKLIIQRQGTMMYCLAINTNGDLTQKNYTDKQIQGKEFGNNLARKVSKSESEEFPEMLARMVLQIPIDEELTPIDILIGIRQDIRMPPELRTLPALLITTKGFGDLAKITPKAMENPIPSFAEVLEVDEYIDVGGEVNKSPCESHINTILRRVYKSRCRVVHVVFANAYCNPLHEKIFLNLLRTAGYKHVYGSHE